MNKKGLIALSFSFVFILFLANFAFADENATAIDNAYNCLRNQTTGKNLSLGDAMFTTLALGGDSFNRLESFKNANSSCWPKGACKLKETAQALLAYNKIGQDTTGIKNWILSRNTTASELNWFLEIDITSKAASSCTIKDGRTSTTSSTITISEDATIAGNPGPCFSIAQNGYMLKVTPSCLRNEFTISCNGTFVTSILYQKAGGNILFVLPEAHSATDSSTTEKINGECLKTGTTCDYEGTLWAALALNKIGVDVSKFMPYLLALSDDNTRFFPSAFLYILTNGDDQYNLIIQQQTPGKFWEITGSREGRYYDTSLAMISLADKSSAEVDATKEYLLSIQTKEGCWENNNVRDTAFILYSGWPRPAGGGGGKIVSEPCEPTYSCESVFDCNTTDRIDTLECPNLNQVCCTAKAPAEETCEQKNGLICSSGTQCNGRVESSADGTCCLEGACINVQAEDTCTPAPTYGNCRAECLDNEDTSSETCSTEGEFCCVAKPAPGLSIWIIILIVLVVLVALGILFRNKLKIWWYKIAEKFKKKPTAQPIARTMMPRQQFGYPRQMIQQRAIRQVPKDKEMEEALRKLREMAGRK
jgi:hypothetical protein